MRVNKHAYGLKLDMVPIFLDKDRVMVLKFSTVVKFQKGEGKWVYI